MRFELRRLTDYSNDAILDEIKRVAAIVQKPKLSKPEFRKHSRVGATTVLRHFGRWEDALRAAGVPALFDSSNKPVSAEEVLAELRRVSQVLGGETYSREQFNAAARFTDAVVRKAFGTWHKAMKAAGLCTKPLGKRYTDDECFENLLNVWTYFGRAPKHDEMNRPPSEVGSKAYVRRFGTWNRALQAFVDQVNADTAESADAPPAEIQVDGVKAPASVCEADRRDIRLSLRYSVLNRDRFRCVLCGRSPATHLGITLHVDHFVPVAKGGKTTFENLRTLCEDCNLGKGSRQEES